VLRSPTTRFHCQGWGVVTATDIMLAWLGGRVVFGDGHPAIDFLLLLAVADDAIGMVRKNEIHTRALAGAGQVLLFPCLAFPV